MKQMGSRHAEEAGLRALISTMSDRRRTADCGVTSQLRVHYQGPVHTHLQITRHRVISIQLISFLLRRNFIWTELPVIPEPVTRLVHGKPPRP